MKNSKALQTKSTIPNPLVSQLCSRTNNWRLIVRAIACIFRFIHQKMRKTIISQEESRRLAINFIIRAVQQESFPLVFKSLLSKKPIPKDDPICSLCPFLDQHDVIRVGGRLQHSSLPYIEKHPVLLPSHHQVTTAILLHCHTTCMHQGRHITLASVRQAGWHILNQGKVIRSFINSCITCKRIRGRFLVQQMADLPEGRMERTPPFTFSGIDVFGPYQIYHGPATRKSSSSKKAWVLLCTCMYSRAVHLETLSSLDTATLRLALRRFIALRGNCQHIISDNGTNFVGAKNQLETSIDLDALRNEVTNDNIVWDFIPPRASHAGGVWERKVGSVKNSLNYAIDQLGSRTLTRDEFDTLLQEAAAIVNQTPLCEISSDPNDPFPVSPYSLLTLRDEPATSPLEFTPKDLLSYGKARWRRVQYLADQFWCRWKRDYASNLQKRNKWKSKCKNVKENDIVLIRQTSHRNCWPLGRVIKCNVSKDGLVRSVTLALKPIHEGVPRTLERSIHDLVLLMSA